MSTCVRSRSPPPIARWSVASRLGPRATKVGCMCSDCKRSAGKLALLSLFPAVCRPVIAAHRAPARVAGARRSRRSARARCAPHAPRRAIRSAPSARSGHAKRTRGSAIHSIAATAMRSSDLHADRRGRCLRPKNRPFLCMQHAIARIVGVFVDALLSRRKGSVMCCNQGQRSTVISRSDAAHDGSIRDRSGPSRRSSQGATADNGPRLDA
jgi:hypothetical protein